MAPSSTSANQILSRISKADLGLLLPHLEPVDLPLRRQLEARNKRIKHIYFLDSGFASVVANGEHNIEIGMIGREGMTGIALVMSSEVQPVNETYMQSAGSGHRINANALRKVIDASAGLHQVMLRYAHTFLMQTAQTALSNGRGKIEERLARWLLMAADRVDGELQLTHEFISIMLGVRRSGVTTALQELERAGLIAHRRGIVTILDREGLEEATSGTYTAPTKFR